MEAVEQHDLATSRGAFCAVNQHCLENIVRLSDNIEVTASSDIYDERGVKLWAKGAPVSPRLQERMLQRRLRQPLEASLDIERGASMENIIADCGDLISNNATLEALGGARVARELLREVRSFRLPGPLKLLLTSAREHKRRSYDISLASMIICSGIAHHLNLSSHSAGMLIVAALVHDIGEMYINPDYLESSRELLPSEWKHVASHPCVGQAFLSEFTSLPPAVAECVLHHHERLDGSGYPFQLGRDDLGQLGQIISVADSVAAIIVRGGSGVAERVAVALRIAPDEFPRQVTSFVANRLAKSCDAGVVVGSDTGAALVARASGILVRLQSARSLATQLLQSASSENAVCAARFVFDSLIGVDKSLRATGVFETGQLAGLGDDPEIAGEVSLVLAEAGWRLRNIARNVYLRSEQRGDASEVAQVTMLAETLNGH